ncbi:MAG: glycosyltransferase [Candidatus Paceibacterota bacterium]
MNATDPVSPNLRIFIVVTRGTVGGAQTSVFNLARELKKTGRAIVRVGFGDGEYLAQRCEDAGIEYTRFAHLRRSLNPFSAIRSVAEFVRHFKRERYDVVHINSSNALFAAVAAKLSRHKPRVVFTFRGLSLLDEHYEMSRMKRRLYVWIFRVLLRFVDEPVFVSHENHATALRMGLVTKGTTIHNGLDPHELVFDDREQARRQLAEMTGVPVTDETFLIGSIGRLAYQKNYEFLIEQMVEMKKKYPALIAVIIGDGPEYNVLLERIKANGLESVVHLVGEITDASRYMRGFDLFVLPSRYEGLSVTLIEALFAGVPVLASDVGGAVEQFEQAPFQVYPLNDGEEFRKRLTRLIDNPDIRDELAEANVRRSEEFAIERVTQAYHERYTQF